MRNVMLASETVISGSTESSRNRHAPGPPLAHVYLNQCSPAPRLFVSVTAGVLAMAILCEKASNLPDARLGLSLRENLRKIAQIGKQDSSHVVGHSCNGENVPTGLLGCHDVTVRAFSILRAASASRRKAIRIWPSNRTFCLRQASGRFFPAIGKSWLAARLLPAYVRCRRQP